MFILDAYALSDQQACRRRFLLASEYRPLHWRPKSLFDACLRKAIVALSSGTEPHKCIAEAQATFMQSAANPGLDLPAGSNPYVIAKDYSAMLSTVLLALSRITLLRMQLPPNLPLEEDFEWRFSSMTDDSGALHRWITADSWTEADLTRELHSWWCIGDIAVAHAPMTLHVIKIGQQREGRRASPWARGYQHPLMPGHPLRFNIKGRTSDQWKTVYLADMPQYDVNEWAERMWREQVAQSLMHHLEVSCPTQAECAEVIRQIGTEAQGMLAAMHVHGASRYRSIPMSRNACDGLVPCPFQEVCYAPSLTTIDDLGLYQHRGHATVSANCSR